MPPHTEKTSDPAPPRTRRTNANVHPGKAAQDALRVRAPRRDPVTIQKEKDAVKERKELKAQDKLVKDGINEATKSIVDEFRVQQASDQTRKEAEMPRQRPKGRVHC